MTNARQEPSDEHLVQAFKGGSAEALEKIVDRYEKAIFNFGLRMCGQMQDAEDVTQETFLSAFRYLNGFRGETKLRNWLYKIAARACLKKRRRKKGQPANEVPLEATGHALSPTALEIPDWSDDPSDSLLRDELRSILKQAIAALPETYRVVFNLRDLEGFSTQETAQMLGISVQAVKTRLHRARFMLRERIASLYGREKAHGR